MGLFKKKKRDNDLRYVGTLQDAYRDMSSVNESPTYYSWGQKNSDRIYASHVPHYGIWCLRTEMCDGLRVTKTVTMLTHKLEEMSYKYKIKSIEGLNRDNNIVLYWCKTSDFSGIPRACPWICQSCEEFQTEEDGFHTIKVWDPKQ